jgi:transcriptional regulator with XRE-family HTH domain
LGHVNRPKWVDGDFLLAQGEGMRLIDYQLERRLTDEEAARHFGVPVPTYRKWKLGRRLPRPEHMRLIAERTARMVTPESFYEKKM